MKTLKDENPKQLRIGWTLHEEIGWGIPCPFKNINIFNGRFDEKAQGAEVFEKDLMTFLQGL